LYEVTKEAKLEKYNFKNMYVSTNYQVLIFVSCQLFTVPSTSTKCNIYLHAALLVVHAKYVYCIFKILHKTTGNLLIKNTLLWGKLLV